jgi:hypothetical protein
MQPIYTLKHIDIQKALQEGSWIVSIILRSLGINNQVTIKELYKCILDDLKKMNFIIKYDRILCNAYGNQSVPAFTKYITPNRTNGGIIMLNPDCSVKEQFECIFHEYVHIKDYSLPLSTTNIGFFKDKTIFYKFFVDFDKAVEKYREVYKNILDDLKRMNFKIIIVLDDQELKLPVFTMFNSLNKTDGGTITLNSRLSTNEKLEALYHEYVGIIDYPLPIYEVNEVISGYKVLVDKSYQRMVEFHADVRTNTLLVPQEKLKQSLMENAYNIDAILKQFDYMETDVLLQWIAINPGIPCHFAWIIYQKDNNNNIVRGLIHDNCYYDPPNDPKLFGIETVLDSADSAAAKAMKSGVPVNQYSNIDNKDYYCYAYYETDNSKEIRKDTVPGSVTIHYDRLLVIGWEKGVYDTMQHLTQMFKEFQRR